MPKVKMVILGFVIALMSGACAVPASASVGWFVNGSKLTTTAALASTAALDKQTTIKANGTKIVCEGKNLNTLDAEIKATNTGAATELEFTECKAESPCKISSTKIGTLPVTFEAAASGSAAVIDTIKPSSGTLLTVIKYEGETCAFVSNQTVTGTIKMESPTGQEERTLQLFNSLASESSGELDVGGKAAALEASALVKLTSGQPWSFVEEPASHWMVGGRDVGTKALGTTAKVDESIVGKSDGVTVECTSSTLNAVEPKIEPENKASAAALEFNECKSVAPTCVLLTKIIKTEPVTVEATLEGTLAVVATFSPKTGTKFGQVTFLGAECPIEGTDPLTGHARVLLPTGHDERTLQLVTSITTESSAELKVGASGAGLKGSVLRGTANGEAWSFL